MKTSGISLKPAPQFITLIFIIPVFIVIAFAAKGASLYGAKTIIIKISEEIRKTLQIDMMKSLIKADTNFIEKRHSGKIITNLGVKIIGPN